MDLSFMCVCVCVCFHWAWSAHSFSEGIYVQFVILYSQYLTKPYMFFPSKCFLQIWQWPIHLSYSKDCIGYFGQVIRPRFGQLFRILLTNASQHISVSCKPRKHARWLRRGRTHTRLHARTSAPAPFCFSLAELLWRKRAVEEYLLISDPQHK